MKNPTLALAVSIFFCIGTEAAEPDLFKDKVCLPFGSKELSKMGAEVDDDRYLTKTEFRFGLATISPDCEVGLQWTEERASSYSDEYMNSIRTIDYIRCPKGFKLAGQLVRFAHFDLNGCLASPLRLINEVKICGQIVEGFTSLPVEIKEGKVSCPNPTKSKSDSKKK